MPSVMSVHQAPTDDRAWEPVSHLHLELVPTVPRGVASALAAGAFLDDVAPEQAAAERRGTHLAVSPA